jgi:hypothetical protein
MKRVLLALALLGLGAGMACADPDDLSNGVFIAHHPVNMVASVPPAGYCAEYLANHAITECDQQVNEINTYDPRIWFVLSQWGEAKTWCGTEFGFGQYEAYNFIMTAWGPCAPGGFLEIPTDGWPGPLEGTAIVTTDTPWSGNFEPVYYFEGYAYYYLPGVIPLDVDPPTGFGGWGNCLTPPESFFADCFGGMGIMMGGYPCCAIIPEAVCCVGTDCYITTQMGCADMGGEWHPEWDTCDPNPCLPPPEHVCCVGEDCYVVTEEECADMQGEWHPEWDDCGPPNPCAFYAVCCVCQDCYITTETECMDMGGEFHPEWDTCDPNPCPASPAESTSWGTIKAIYR